MHPIDITSSVTITTGSGHQLWYPPPAGAHHASYQNTSDHNPMETSHEGYHNRSQTHPLLNYPSSSSHGFKASHYPITSNGKAQGHYPPSSSSKAVGQYPPSSTSKTQQHSMVPSGRSSLHFSQSSAGRPHQLPPSSAGKSDRFPPSAFPKPQGDPTYYSPPAGKNQLHPPPGAQGVAHYPPSSTSKTKVQENAGQGGHYYPPSSMSKPQFPSTARSVLHYPPSSVAKTQQHSSAGQHYAPSSTGKIPHFPPSTGGRDSEKYLPSSAAKSDNHFPEGHVSPYYPPSSSSKTQANYYPPSSAPKPQEHSPAEIGVARYPPSSTSKTHPSPSLVDKTIDRFPPSSFTKTEYSSAGQSATPHYPPSSASKTHQIRPSSGVAVYPPSSTSKTQQVSPSAGKSIDQYPPSSFSKTQHELPPSPAYYPPSSNSRSQVHHRQNVDNYQPSSFSKSQQHSALGHETPHYPPSSSSKTHPVDRSPAHFSPSSLAKPLNYYPPSSAAKTNQRHYPPSSTSKFQPNPEYYPPSSNSKTRPEQLNGTSGGYSQTIRPLTAAGGTHGQEQGHHYLQGSANRFAQSGNYTKFYPGTLYASTRISAVYAPQFFPSSADNHQGHAQYGLPQSHHLPSQLQPQTRSGSHYSPVSHHTSVLERPTSNANAHGAYPSSPVGKTHHTVSPHYPLGSKTHYSHDGGPSYPPSSTSTLHFTPVTQSSGAPSAAQIPVPPTGRAPYPEHQSSVQGHNYQGHFPHSTSNKQPDAGQGIHSAYYPPSSSSRHKFSSTETYAPAYYPSSSAGKHHFDPQSQSARTPPLHVPNYESGSRNAGTHGPVHDLHHLPYNDSVVGQHHGSPQFPPSSNNKIHPPPHNASLAGHHYGPVPSNDTDSHSGAEAYGGQYVPPSGVHRTFAPAQPCSQLSITTRTILTPNGVIQRPPSFRNNGAPPCGFRPRVLPNHGQNSPCGPVIQNGQIVKSETPCLITSPAPKPPQENFGAVVTDVGETQAEVLQGIGYPMPHHQFSRLEEEKKTANGTKDGSSGRPENDVEEFEEEDKREQAKPDADPESKSSEEKVKEGDVLEPGDRILGKDGYTISEGFRGRVLSVTGQVGKTRAEPGKDAEKSNSGHFRYNSDLGRYVKDNSGKSYSNCQGEPTFTCTEFLGSNGRAKICKPNPRRNPDGTPC